jgi:hypothetical protein
MMVMELRSKEELDKKSYRIQCFLEFNALQLEELK